MSSSLGNFPFQMTIFCVLLLLIVFTGTVQSQCASNIACFAPAVDVSKIPAHNLTVNSTCGTPSESFCVDTDCSLICDASNNQTFHPPAFLVDQFDLLTYWKSKNFDEPVFIQFDFGTELILHQITVTFQFELPNGLYIQRSQDFGQTFFTLAYYAIKCADTFGLSEADFYDGTKVLCFLINPNTVQRQISYAPRRDSNIATGVLEGGSIRDYYTASNIKIVLQAFFTPSNFDRQLADPRKFYFAVRDVDVQAACYCNGMTNQCSSTDYGTCLCQKNTQGKHCELCLPLFNNKPWTFGQACESCTCNLHSSTCSYDASKGYGVCLDCIHNTKGDKCDSCNTEYYRDITKDINDINVCKACNCFKSGVLFGSTVCHPVTGSCICKSNVEEGGKCDTCKDGFYGLKATILNGCSACACATFGTVGGTSICNKVSGVCPCKQGFTGRTCSNCQDGFYGFPVANPSECRTCNCNPSGSLGTTCDTSGQCECRTNYYGAKCEQIVTGFFSASVNQLLISSSSASISSPVSTSLRYMNLTDSQGNSFYILGYSIGLGGSSSSATFLTFTINLSKSGYYEMFLQYMSTFSFANVNMNLKFLSAFVPYSCDGGTSTISVNTARALTSNLDPSKQSQSFGTLCLSNGTYELVVWFPPNSAGSSSSSAAIFILSLLILPAYQFSIGYQQADSATQLLIQQSYQFASSRTEWAVQEGAGAQYMSYLYALIYDNALACECNVVGAINPQVCNVNGGQCNCKHNIHGRTCDACIPEHYNFTSGLGCIGCNCDSLGSINSSCDPFTGQCFCKPNVVGRTCNQCALQYFGLSTGGGCQSCGCEVLYSLSTNCDDNGQCTCKPGVGSKKCSQCLAGFYDLTIAGCKQCSCDPIGTSGNLCNDQTGSCTCKSLTMGARCDQCTIGYYGFSSVFPETCLKCHCTGKTQECDAAEDFYLTTVQTRFPTIVNSVTLSGWKGVDTNGADAGKISWDWAPNYSIDFGFAKLHDDTGLPELFFSAPQKFLGDKRSSYMYYLAFDLTQQNDSNPIDPANNGDVILKGKSQSYTLVMRLSSPPLVHMSFRQYRIRLYEKNWFKDTVTGPQATNGEMVDTLSNLEYIWIRAKWSKDPNLFAGLSNVTMEYSTYNITDTTGLEIAKNVEYCTCPIQYGGQYCQNCNTGYTRTPPDGSSFDNCIACQCNQHSTNCDPQNGLCFNCQHHTEGNNCETCSAGYYGLATVGQVDDCKECKCPGGLTASNQFAQTCILDQDDKPTCVNCQLGYSGRNCEVCSDGYYGDPMVPQGKCQKCVCNDNVNPQAAGNCNTSTGECLRCLYNTVGNTCQFCRPGFYGDAITQSCNGCSCNLVGSNSNECQNITGQCSCKPNVIGRICDTCAENTYNFASNIGCQLCECNTGGSTSLQCNLVTGKCTCKPRVTGDKCDQCETGYYDISKGCLPCSCSVDFTVKNTTCDAITGQCVCQTSALGGKYSGRTCSDCDINAIGSPPNCELCHEPCYDNWQSYIDQEASDIAMLQANISDLLSKFGSMSYESVQSNLNWLNGNLTLVSNVFSGATYNISGKEEQFNLIENLILEFGAVLSQATEILEASREYFLSVVTNFNGSVSLTTTIIKPIPVPTLKLRVRRDAHIHAQLVDAATVTEMAQEFITTTKKNNVSGHAVFATIQNQFDQIVSTNNSVADAVRQLSAALVDLSQSAVERSKITLYLDTQFRATFATNAYELQKIHDIVASIMILQNRTVTIYNNAQNTLSNAQNTITKAESEAKTRQNEAEVISQTVSRMKVDVVMLNSSVGEQVKVATTLKNKADDVLYDVNREIDALAQGVRDVAEARNKTEQSLALANEIINATLPVQLIQIQQLSNQIISTVINEGVINSTYADAQNGLVKAQEVQTRSQQALSLSQQTLQDIQNLEQDLLRSKELRQSATQIQSENDMKVKEIQNITVMIENQFNAANGHGGQTLAILQSAMTQAEASKMCYVNAKATVDNATILANQAYTQVQQAFTLHQSNSAALPTYATQINNLYTQTSTTHSNAQLAADSASKLLQDVGEAERLLAQFTTQKTELDALQRETDSLEAELNDLLLKFEAERVKFSDCSRP